MERSQTGVSARYTATFYLILSCCLMGTESDIYFQVETEPGSIHRDQIYFSLDKFKEFYHCLCNQNVTLCKADYSSKKQPYQVSSLSSEMDNTGQIHASIFTCSKDSDGKSALVCRRVHYSFGICQSGRTDFIRVPEKSSCNKNCLGFHWQSAGNFVHNETEIEPCYLCATAAPTKPPAGNTTISPTGTPRTPSTEIPTIPRVPPFRKKGTIAKASTREDGGIKVAGANMAVIFVLAIVTMASTIV